MNHSISYAAETEQPFRAHRREADLIIASYLPLLKNATEAEVRSQQAAQRLRLAELYREIGNTADAEACIREALEFDPGSEGVQNVAREFGVELGEKR